MMKRRLDWSKAYPCRPKDNLCSHVYAKGKKFVPSYERDPCPPSMGSLLAWEYSRIWLKERDAFMEYRGKQSKPKPIGNDFEWWLQKHAPKHSGKRF